MNWLAVILALALVLALLVSFSRTYGPKGEVAFKILTCLILLILMLGGAYIT